MDWINLAQDRDKW